MSFCLCPLKEVAVGFKFSRMVWGDRIVSQGEFVTDMNSYALTNLIQAPYDQ